MTWHERNRRRKHRDPINFRRDLRKTNAAMVRIACGFRARHGEIADHVRFERGLWV